MALTFRTVLGFLAGSDAGKGLIKSKTAGTATVALGAKITGVFLLPLPTWLQYVLVGTVLAEWGVQLYLRVITKEPVA